ncbi:MAG: dihydroorotase [Sphaerochaeta sp.]|jgi:dihydroorotase|nr:dihydroorotase [Sphaerochaeta sp.]
MIDPHVHLRDGVQASKETILHGLTVASRCGFDWVFDMPNCNPPLTGTEAIQARLEMGRTAEEQVLAQTGRPIRYSVYAGLMADEQAIKTVVDAWRKWFPRVVGLKLFAGNSTGNMGQVTEEAQRKVYRTLSRLGYTGVLAVHCEKESLLRPDLEDPSDFSSHSLARPIETEIASVSDQIRFAREEGFQGVLHICHLSVAECLPLVEQGRKDGLRITSGATAHHLLLNADDAKDHRLYAKMNPPLRDEAHRALLFQALCDGRIDWVESDHAPHTIQDKEKGASGIPGFSGSLLLLDRLYREGVAESRIRSLFGERVREVFGLPSMDITMVPPSECRNRSDAVATAYPYDGFLNYRS